MAGNYGKMYTLFQGGKTPLLQQSAPLWRFNVTPLFGSNMKVLNLLMSTLLPTGTSFCDAFTLS